MKKVLGLLLISTLFFTGCEKAKENDKNIVTSQAKVQELGEKFDYINTDVNKTVEFGRVLTVIDNKYQTDLQEYIRTEITNKGELYLHYKEEKLKLLIPNNEKVVAVAYNGADDSGETGSILILTETGNIYEPYYSYDNRLYDKDFKEKDAIKLPFYVYDSIKALSFVKGEGDSRPSYYGVDDNIHSLEWNY